MDLQYEEKRGSDSPFVDRVWRSHSETAGGFLSLADIHSSLVVSRFGGKTWLTFRGPETRWSSAWAPPEAEWLGIVLKPGVFLGPLPPSRLRDRQDLTLEGSRQRGFSWGGMALEIPNFTNAEGIVDRLVQTGLLLHDPLVADVLDRRPLLLSERTLQRRFHHATGLTPITAFQVQRVRRAAALLREGVPMADTVFSTGYFDQSHLTRSFQRFIGVSPGRMSLSHRAEILSFLEPADVR